MSYPPNSGYPSWNPWNAPQNPFGFGGAYPVPVAVPCFGYQNSNFFGNHIWEPNQGQGQSQPWTQSSNTSLVSRNPAGSGFYRNPPPPPSEKSSTTKTKSKPKKTKTPLPRLRPRPTLKSLESKNKAQEAPVISIRQNGSVKIFRTTEECYILINDITKEAFLALRKVVPGYKKDDRFSFPNYMCSVVEATLEGFPLPSSSVPDPKSCSSISSSRYAQANAIPIYWLSHAHDRYFVDWKDLPAEAISSLANLHGCYSNSKTQKVHFLVGVHARVQFVLSGLIPPLRISDEPEPEYPRRASAKTSNIPPMMNLTKVSTKPSSVTKYTENSRGDLWTVPCWRRRKDSDFFFFWESDLSEEGIQFFRKNTRLPIFPRGDGDKSFWYFRHETFQRIASALLSLSSPCNLELQIDTEKVTNGPLPGNRAQTSASAPVLIDLTVSPLPKAKSKANSNRSAPNAATATFANSYLKQFEKIPGFHFLKYLNVPSHLEKLTGGKFFKAFIVKLSSEDIHNFHNSKNKQAIIIRLIGRNKGRASTADQGFRIVDVRRADKAKSAKFSSRKATEFSVDISNFFTRTESSSIEVRAKYENEQALDASDYEIHYSVSILRRYSVEEMLDDLTRKSQILLAVTRKKVTDSLKEAEEAGILASDPRLLISLTCPLGKNLMTRPCKGIHCEHYTCFDAKNFFQIYENSPHWKCPVCDCPVAYEDLRIDSFFDVIIRSIGEEAKNFNIKVDSSGEFHVVPISEDNPTVQHNETIALIEDEDDILIDVSSLEDFDDGDLDLRKRKMPDLNIVKKQPEET